MSDFVFFVGFAKISVELYRPRPLATKIPEEPGLSEFIACRRTTWSQAVSMLSETVIHEQIQALATKSLGGLLPQCSSYLSSQNASDTQRAISQSTDK